MLSYSHLYLRKRMVSTEINFSSNDGGKDVRFE